MLSTPEQTAESRVLYVINNNIGRMNNERHAWSRLSLLVPTNAKHDVIGLTEQLLSIFYASSAANFYYYMYPCDDRYLLYYSTAFLN